MATGRRGLIFLRDLFFPPRCISCRCLLEATLPTGDESDALCQNCRRAWESETLETCGICAKRVTACTCMPKHLQAAKCAGLCKSVYYAPQKREPVQNKLIYRIKHQKDGRALYFLASELLRSMERIMEEDGVDRDHVLITYLPRGRMTRLKVGTDQALCLAREISRQSGLHFQTLLARTRKHGREQKRLTRAARLQNAERSFCPLPGGACKGYTVFLVDDLVTTGAGMSVCTKLLRSMGAKQVYGVAVAADEINKDPQIAF